jgi:predicted HAD superfamily phosphohydrolase
MFLQCVILLRGEGFSGVQLVDMDLTDSAPFTVFAPAADAVAKLVELFVAEGCDAISREVLNQVSTRLVLRISAI